MHHDLVVAGEGIQEAEQFTPRGIVYQGIDAGQRVRILWAGFVEIREVDTHSPLPICFLY